MKVLGIDVGREWGWQFYDNGFAENGCNKGGLYDFGSKVKELLTLYRPEVVVTASPTRFHNVIKSQSKLLGILEYFCYKEGIEYKEYIDSHCKKVVLGKGRVDKQEIIDHFNVGSEHIADACLFIKTYIYENRSHTT